MRRMSKKRAAEHRKRIAYLRSIDADQAICERCHAHRAEECHEVHTRARGGSITDGANFKLLCHGCHDWVTNHSAEAHALGYVIHSWEAS